MEHGLLDRAPRLRTRMVAHVVTAWPAPHSTGNLDGDCLHASTSELPEQQARSLPVPRDLTYKEFVRSHVQKA
jgi:hypothetical protein